MWREHMLRCGYRFWDDGCEGVANLDKLKSAMFMYAYTINRYSLGFRLEMLYDRVYWRWNPCSKPECSVPCVSSNIWDLLDEARGKFYIRAIAGGSWSGKRLETWNQ